MHIQHAAQASGTTDACEVLGDQQWRQYGAINARLKQNLVAVHTHVNNAARAPFQPPAGAVVVVRADTPIAQAACVMGDRPGSVIIFVPIEESHRFSDEYFVAGLARLKEALTAKAGVLSVSLVSDPLVDGRDAEAWQATISTGSQSVGNSVAVVKAEGEQGQCEYLLRVQTDAGEAGSLACKAAVSGRTASTTVGEFASSQLYRRIERLALRNAQRLAAMAATILGVRVLADDDQHAHLANAHDIPPQLARPSIVNRFESMRCRDGDDGAKTVCIFNKVVDTTGAVGGCTISSNPTFRTRVYSLRTKEGRELGRFRNSAVDSFPVFHGKKRDAAGALVPCGRIPEGVQRRIQKTFTWQGQHVDHDGQRSATFHPAMAFKANTMTPEKHKWFMEKLGAANAQWVDYSTVMAVLSGE